MGNVVQASAIASYLNSSLFGKDMKVIGVTSLAEITENFLVFSKKNSLDDIKALAIVPLDFSGSYDNLTFIKVQNPRLAFAKVVNEFFVKNNQGTVDKSAIIGINCKIDSSVSIGANCTIGNNVKISEKSVLNSNIVIADNTIIGKNCYIKSGSVIGEDGFGFDFEQDGTPVRLPHLGAVTIGDNVEIGAKNTIAKGTLTNTIINNYVKTDDQVHIAHNCEIGENTIITACAEISGSVTIGKNCWIGPNCSIIQKVKIGDNVTIGIGAIITKNIESEKKVMGFEALELRSLLKLKKRIEYGK